LVIGATVLAIIVGVAVGIISAVRKYSGFDYVITFGAFIFFSLPVFWAAVLLKEYGAIRFNDWIADPGMSATQMIVIAAVVGLLLQFALGGTPQRRLITAGATFAVAVAALAYFDAENWYRDPSMGLGMVVLVSAAAGVLVTSLVTGFSERRVLYAALTTVGAGAIITLSLDGVLDDPSYLLLVGLFVLTILVSVGIGLAWGGYMRRQAVLVSWITGAFMSVMVVLDHAVSHWETLLDLKPRPVLTIGSESPNFEGDFWESFLDTGTQLLLPTVLLTLISVASYSRYTRSSMLEVLEQDYVRTARAKGVSERAVITKHAFRNALIPLTTIVAFDFASLISGAVVTEQVFGWRGMGQMFISGLRAVDPMPVMSFVLVTGTAAVLMNLAADIMYGYLDPRIRR
ncbi:ABC transporter permease, partial [Phytoactinopolyspora endophytica]|uniref:ABC transporter permease n=1 Tax=Phytoactinopolyspora endophytica TaxID=1642495 RepID=UPI00197C9727